MCRPATQDRGVPAGPAGCLWRARQGTSGRPRCKLALAACLRRPRLLPQQGPLPAPTAAVEVRRPAVLEALVEARGSGCFRWPWLTALPGPLEHPRPAGSAPLRQGGKPATGPTLSAAPLHAVAGRVAAEKFPAPASAAKLRCRRSRATRQRVQSASSCQVELHWDGVEVPRLALRLEAHSNVLPLTMREDLDGCVIHDRGTLQEVHPRTAMVLRSRLPGASMMVQCHVSV